MPTPTAVVRDSRSIQSAPGRSGRAAYCNCNRCGGTNVRAADGTLGKMLAPPVSRSDEEDWAQIGALAEAAHKVAVESGKAA